MNQCDLEDGCLLSPQADGQITATMPEQPAQVIFVTDPICSHCWAIEPVWRRLQLNYAIKVRYIHGGLLPGWKNFADAGNAISKPTDVIPHWRHVAEYYQQPIDPSVWQNDPIDNSYILCQAAIAVRLLAPELESVFVRNMREKIFLWAENPARIDTLAAMVAAMGLDKTAFLTLMQSQQMNQLFQQERASMQQLGARGFPSLIFMGEKNISLSGSRPYQQLESALKAITGQEPTPIFLSKEEKLVSYHSWTLREAMEVLQADELQTRALLHRCEFGEMKIAGSSFWSRTIG